MHTRLLSYLCYPIDSSPLCLSIGSKIENDRVETGDLVSEVGRTYPIINGVPRILVDEALRASVQSFGDEWNYFNYDRFKANWLKHIANGAFGSQSRSRLSEQNLRVDKWSLCRG